MKLCVYECLHLFIKRYLNTKICAKIFTNDLPVHGSWAFQDKMPTNWSKRWVSIIHTVCSSGDFYNLRGRRRRETTIALNIHSFFGIHWSYAQLWCMSWCNANELENFHEQQISCVLSLLCHHLYKFIKRRKELAAAAANEVNEK